MEHNKENPEFDPEKMSANTDEEQSATPQEEPQPKAAASLTLEEQVSQLQEDLLEARDRTMRALADAENTRRRAQKEREDAGRYAISKFARSMLDFSDNFERALEAIPDDLKSVDPRITNVINGIEAMERELQKVFEQNGVEKLEPIDEPFDANFHEIMFEMPVADKKPGTVTQVIETGYVLNGRLLRAAKVGIAKEAPAAPAESSEGPAENEQTPPKEPGNRFDQEA